MGRMSFSYFCLSFTLKFRANLDRRFHFFNLGFWSTDATMSDKVITIALPSLIHRIGGEQTKKARSLADEFNCKLSRVRRSRNWQISGLAPNQAAFCKHIKSQTPEPMAYLIRKLDEGLEKHKDKLEPEEARLKRIIEENPNITLNELMAQTNCSISEARKARFDSDVF